MTLDQLLSKAFNGKAENIVISKNIIMFHLDGVETRINLVSFIDQIYKDHEAQIKAKDSITQDIKEAYEFKSIAYDLLLEAIKARDEEIERLKADCELNGLRMFRQGVNSQKKADIGWLKARSIVAMLFWEWRKSEARIYATNIKWNTGRAFQSQILFEAAYKILKEQQ